jgi:hypothetical protein
MIKITCNKPLLVAKIKTVPGRKWHPEKKYWSFPDIDGTSEKILKAFEGEEIHLNLFLQTQLSPLVISRRKSGGQSSYTLELLRRELLSRKYSNNWHICIASILPNWTDIYNSCRYEGVRRKGDLL